MEKMVFRKAALQDLKELVSLFSLTRGKMLENGITQWDSSYPAAQDLKRDIDSGYGYVLETGSGILVYGALLNDPEPAYEKIAGKWLTESEYATIHRLAVNPLARRKKLASCFLERIEQISIKNGMPAIRMDTNYDNSPMLGFLKKRGFIFCGEICYNGSPKMAFEKILFPH